jgi:hypothetical protein
MLDYTPFVPSCGLKFPLFDLRHPRFCILASWRLGVKFRSFPFAPFRGQVLPRSSGVSPAGQGEFSNIRKNMIFRKLLRQYLLRKREKAKNFQKVLEKFSRAM